VVRLALEAPGLDVRDFIKRRVKKIMGFLGGAQNEKYGPGGARVRNDRNIKRSIKKMLGF